jgi:hypothetical protein
MDMNILKSVGILLLSALPLFAQEHQLSEHELAVYHGSDDAVRSVMNYCDATDDFSQRQQPRLFAELKSGPTESQEGRWQEFTGKDEWTAGGKPAPLAFVWDRNGAIVRVTVVSRPPKAWNPHGAYRRVDYCYGADAQLIRIRAVWYDPTHCEYLFPCRLIEGHEFFLGQNPGITDWVFTPEGQIRKLRNGKVWSDRFDPSYSLTVSELHLKTSNDLPFSRPAK